MKFFKSLWTAVVLAQAAMVASAETLTVNPLTISPLEVTPGETTELVMNYNTDESYIGLQFELILPDGINFVMSEDDDTELEDATINTSLAKTHSLSALLKPSGLYRAVFVSLKNSVIKSGGWLIKIPVKVSTDFKGSAQGLIQECRFATTDHEDEYLQPDYFDIYVAPTAITMSETSLTLEEEASATLSVNYQPASAAALPVEWKSSDESVATVKDGKVTALKAGKTTITATTSNGLTATCDVTVKIKVIEATGITLDQTSASLKVGESVTLTATVSPENATDKTVTWTSSNASVATVDANGKITALALGEATVTAACGNVKATCAVTVIPTPVASLTLDKTAASLKVGESVVLTATVLPEDATDKTVTWSSSNAAVASVDAQGKVTALALGEATITAKCGEFTATCAVTVVPTPATGITLNLTSATLKEGDSMTLSATVQPSDATDKTITWSSSDEAIATVDANGTVTAVAIGEAIITASCGDVKATCAVTVVAQTVEVTEITLDKEELTLTEGETATITATVLPEDATDKSATWISSDPSVATVEAGVVTAVKAGEAIITASASNGLTATCKVTVNAKEPDVVLVSEIVIEPSSIEALPGTQVQLIFAVLPDDATNKALEWESSNEAVAKVDANGVVTIVSEGLADITASATDGSGVKAVCHVSGLSGIEDLILREGNPDVYTVGGFLLRRAADAQYISTLAKGVYILKYSDHVYKVVK